MARSISARKVVMISFLVDILDVVTNLIVVLITGSAVVFSEMAQGVADSMGSALLVIGERRAIRPRDDKHPLGYAREAFFWGLLSSVAMLVIGSGLSAWRGLQQLLHPEPLQASLFAVAVLALAVVTNGYAVSLSARKLATEHGGLFSIFHNFSQPLVKGAFLRDVIGTITSIVGLAALMLYEILDLLIFDAIGAIVAALLMAAGSLVLMAHARASVHGLVASKEKAPYVASKFGLTGLSRVAALEYAEIGSRETGGVTVNTICPGWTETTLIEPQIRARSEEFGGDRDAGIASLLSEKQPSLRTSKPEEIGELALWLCSTIAHNITGISIPVDGGWTTQ